MSCDLLIRDDAEHFMMIRASDVVAFFANGLGQPGYKYDAILRGGGTHLTLSDALADRLLVELRRLAGGTSGGPGALSPP